MGLDVGGENKMVGLRLTQRHKRSKRLLDLCSFMSLVLESS